MAQKNKNDNPIHLCHSIFTTKKQMNKQKRAVMDILLSESGFWNTPDKINCQIPLILTGNESCLCLLIKDIHKDLSDFILTGKRHSYELHVFSEAQEREMAAHWGSLGLKATYRSQQITYMNTDARIVYLHVSDPSSGMGISLIPWFMLPGRPYPVFVYIYAIWHYHVTGKKSLSRSAAAAGKVFGVNGLNKSTVSRSIKAFEGFIDVSRIEKPLAADGRDAPSNEEMLGHIPEMLKGGPSVKEKYCKLSKPIPAPVSRVLSGIPQEHSQIINGGPTKTPRDIRKRTGQPRSRWVRRVQRQPAFADYAQVEKARSSFIEVCKHLVLDAAANHRRFLL